MELGHTHRTDVVGGAGAELLDCTEWPGLDAQKWCYSFSSLTEGTGSDGVTKNAS